MTMFQTDDKIICPLCQREFKKPTRADVNLSGVDVALGLAPGMMASQHMYNQARELEEDLRRHFTDHHRIEEWVAAIVNLEQIIASIHSMAHLWLTSRKEATADDTADLMGQIHQKSRRFMGKPL